MIPRHTDDPYYMTAEQERVATLERRLRDADAAMQSALETLHLVADYFDEQYGRWNTEQALLFDAVQGAIKTLEKAQ